MIFRGYPKNDLTEIQIPITNDTRIEQIPRGLIR
jgi:hypothetical protein